MQIEIYDLIAGTDSVNFNLYAICDSFSSLLWDIEFYECGCFEVYIAATPQNVDIFRRGRIVTRSDDSENYGIIESIKIETNAENGDYLTVSGRFLNCLLERRIIYPSFTVRGTYADAIKFIVDYVAIKSDIRRIPGLVFGEVLGECWNKDVKLQVSYANMMEWFYKIGETIGGSFRLLYANNQLKLNLIAGTDRSISQNKNPHIIFSDAYNNLLSFTYAEDSTAQKNFAYVFGSGEGKERKQTTYFTGTEPSYLDRYEVYVDERNTSQDEDTTDEEYLQILKNSGAESLQDVTIASESTIVADFTQFQYNKDYFVGDYVTIENRRFGLQQAKIQLVGMVESFDQNGRSLTPTFKGA